MRLHRRGKETRGVPEVQLADLFPSNGSEQKKKSPQGITHSKFFLYIVYNIVARNIFKKEFAYIDTNLMEKQWTMKYAWVN
jgi:hypothetical protein